MKYRVLWKKTWKKLTIFMSIAISIPLAITMFGRYREVGTYGKTFEYLSLLESVVFVVGFSAGVSLIISLFIKLSAIEIKDGHLIGRNYWYFKRRIPIPKISSIYPFSHNGVEAMVADGGLYGKVYIPKQTENLSELIELLENYTK